MGEGDFEKYGEKRTMKMESFLSWYKDKEESDFQVEPKNAYERAWACRDFELSHLWQRSVFLAVFLLAIAGAYGTLLLNIYFPSEQNQIFIWTDGKEDWKENTAAKRIEYRAKDATWQQHAIASGVCWLGITFSVLWVMMAKGSKYWFERYEKGINKYEYELAGEKIKDCPHHGEMPLLEKHQYDENIFSTKAGHYSVSRVNAVIGIISLISFSFLEMLHFGNFLNLKIDSLNNLQCAIFSFASWLGAGAVLFAFLRYLCKTSYNNEKDWE